MELQGKIIAALEIKKGTSARGEWQVQEYVLETHDSYPKKMMFSVFGADRIQRFAIQVGQEVNVSFDIDAHEYNRRWFNSIRAFDVRPAQPGGAAPVAPAAPVTPFAEPAAAPAPAAPAPAAEGSTDDLPF